MIKGKLLSVEEVNGLVPSEKEYWVEWPDNMQDFNNNELYHLIDERFRNKTNNNGFRQGCYGIENNLIKVYEYEEEIIIKEYKTWELLKLAESYKNEGIPLKERPRYKNEDDEEVVIGTSGYENGLFTINGITYKGNISNKVWTLVTPEPVDMLFMEAIKEYYTGKEVYSLRGKSDINNYNHVGAGMTDQYGRAVAADEILHAKWFIRD
ncbi:hypothetical protein [Clostridium estertheticum]|uniref:hypothetical protein n=1 Tax=Clostridium estertheticum TaxID=238834 RepID=UPI001C0E3471|nr:hypothetical protein [Clostridium estertheticum]MBU3186537.1 hypothetical protein [Clostridium estertheticum]